MAATDKNTENKDTDTSTSGTAVNASPNAGTQPQRDEALETTAAPPSAPSAHTDRVAMVSYTKDGHPDQSADFEVIREPRPGGGATEPGESILGGQPQRPATREAAGAITPVKSGGSQAEPTEGEGNQPAAKDETGRR